VRLRRRGGGGSSPRGARECGADRRRAPDRRRELPPGPVRGGRGRATAGRRRAGARGSGPSGGDPGGRQFRARDAAGRAARARAAAHLGDVEEARSAAERGATVSAEIGDEIFLVLNRAVLGFLELSLGDLQTAAADLQPAARYFRDRGWREPSIFDVLPNTIEA